MWILRGTHIEVDSCTFDSLYPRADHTTAYRGSTIYRDSQYNHIHDCTFSHYGNASENGGGVVFELGNESSPNTLTDTTSHNIIENCHMYGAAHHVFGMNGSYNVVRNNYFHNENWMKDDNGLLWGDRVLMCSGYYELNKRNLFENNRVAFAGITVELNQVGGLGWSLASSYNIIRKNLFYNNPSCAFQPKYYPDSPGKCNYNKIYNNVMFYNGQSSPEYKTNWTPGFTHVMLFSELNGDAIDPNNMGNIIKNNIFYKNKNQMKYSVSIVSNKYPNLYGQIVENNWEQDRADPLFINAVTDLQPFDSLPDGFLHLSSTSPCIDAGGPLTTITSPGGSGTSFQVADAGYFMDGWGIEHVLGDEIRLAGTTQRARIIAVNYATNTMTVDRTLTWTQNQGISLIYEGSAPDIGAYEYVPGLSLGSPTGGETWVHGFSHDITWSSSGVTEPVKIELFKASALQWDVTVPVTDGSYAWPIPNGQTPGNDYTIKISAGSYSDTSEPFTIAAPAAPIVQTLAAQSITTSSAVLRGTVHPMGLATTYYFEYGLTTAYGSETAVETLAAGDQVTTVQASIAGLKASTIYHFRLTATNSAGTTEGNDLTFTTSGGGGGGGGGDSGGGGGGGGGCFIAAVQGLSLWFMVLGMVSGLLVWTRQRAKRLKCHL
jgi:hypothetical protein